MEGITTKPESDDGCPKSVDGKPGKDKAMALSSSAEDEFPEDPIHCVNIEPFPVTLYRVDRKSTFEGVRGSNVHIVDIEMLEHLASSNTVQKKHLDDVTPGVHSLEGSFKSSEALYSQHCDRGSNLHGVEIEILEQSHSASSNIAQRKQRKYLSDVTPCVHSLEGSSTSHSIDIEILEQPHSVSSNIAKTKYLGDVTPGVLQSLEGSFNSSVALYSQYCDRGSNVRSVEIEILEQPHSASSNIAQAKHLGDVTPGVHSLEDSSKSSKALFSQHCTNKEPTPSNADEEQGPRPCPSSKSSDSKKHKRTQIAKKPHKRLVYVYRSARKIDSKRDEGTSTLKTLKKCKRVYTVEKPYKCTVCPYSCARKDAIKRHERTHTGVQPYKCIICAYSCARKDDLMRHERTHTGEQPYKCIICAYSCARKDDLLRHERTHTGEVLHECSVCPYNCARKDDLIRHEKTHTGEVQYKCSICPYRCARKDDLKRHERTHTWEQPYKCSICPFSCARIDGLKRHERTHTGEQPYRCSICGYSYARKDSLKRHEKIHSSKKPRQC